MTTQTTPSHTANPTPRQRKDDPPMIDARLVHALLREHPRLHLFGHGPHPSLTLEPATYAELTTPSSRVRTTAALAWLEANAVPAARGTRKRARSTYVLKHVMQRTTGLYVYNGEMAAAALLSHISVETDGWFNPLVFCTLTTDTTRAGGSDRGPADNTRR